jgi:(1->4)-alpha-D-glucan 1-alpha-D-glucosylmutase
VFVEKILAADEALAADWEIAGTTGYETAVTLTAALVDPDGMAALARVAGGSDPVPFRDVERAAKRQVIDDLLVPEWRRVRGSLDAAAAASGIATDRDVLATALREITVALDVYRTYDGCDPDRIERAATAARQGGVADPAALAAVQELLTTSTDASRALLVRWEQLSGAVMAKGHEDTAEYRISAALALADVGGDPGDDARDAVARFHTQQETRVADGRAGMTATTTHDTKRSEDTRARLAALTEHADAYAAGFARWLELLAPPAELTRTVLDFVAQTLLATWPLAVHEHEHGRYADRITSYLLKARHEAKQETSWLAPDADAEARVLDVARRTLADDGRLFHDAFGALIDDVAWFGAVNGLAQLTWKLGAPGTADIYRGAELWDLHLVDPDNRLPVDFDARMTMLREPSDDWRSGAVKLHMTAAGLRARAAHPDLFRSGEYLPLAVPDNAALAFVRHDGHAWAIACAPRLPARLAPRDHWPVGDAVWGHRALELPTGAPAHWRDAYTDALVTAADGRLRIADVLTRLPAALLLSD